MAWSKKARFLSPVEVLENPEEWDYFTDLELMKSRGSSICMTCEHFTYTCDKSCVTLLTCPLNHLLLSLDGADLDKEELQHRIPLELPLP